MANKTTSALAGVFDKGNKENVKSSTKFSTSELKEPTLELVDVELKNQLNNSIELVRDDIIKSSNGLFDVSNPEQAIEVREEKIRDM